MSLRPAAAIGNHLSVFGEFWIVNCRIAPARWATLHKFGYGSVEDRAGVASCALGLLSPVGPVAAECVDRSGPSKDLATMRHIARDELFLSGLQPESALH